MAEAARARAAHLHPGLPDEIFIWEILLRLPRKPLLRCRAVCRAWLAATSSREFLLAHHGRQPSLPLLYARNNTTEGGGYLDIMPLDHRAGVAPADELHPVARLGTGAAFTHIEASCDGLIILCTNERGAFPSYYVCNPATRQHAPLPHLRGFCVIGMYPHPPTGEYWLLLYPEASLVDDEPEPGAGFLYSVYALGSREQPRDIGFPEAETEAEEDDALHLSGPLLFRGGLHWFLEKGGSEGCMIVVFDTTSELFREMRSPAVPGVAELFEMDQVLGMASFKHGVTPIDIWMTQDYDSEVWAFKYRVELPVADLTMRFGLDNKSCKVVVSSWDDEGLLILVQSGEWLLQIDMGGKLVASFHRELLGTTQLRLKQTLVQHSFFQTMEGYVVNSLPFISPDDHVVNT